jgi:hypothetical protein
MEKKRNFSKEKRMIQKSKQLLKAAKTCNNAMINIRVKLKTLNGCLAMMQKRLIDNAKNIDKLLDESIELATKKKVNVGDTLSPLSILYHSKRTCVICNKTKSEHKFLYSDSCSHVFCGKCITKNIEFAPDPQSGRKCLTCREPRDTFSRVVKVGSCYQMAQGISDEILREFDDDHLFDTSESEVDEDDIADERDILNAIPEDTIVSFTSKLMNDKVIEENNCGNDECGGGGDGTTNFNNEDDDADIKSLIDEEDG